MRKPIQLSKRAMTAVVTVMLCVLIVSTVVAQSSISTITISSGIYPGAPSYTIWTESGMCYAKNANGQLMNDWSSINASYTIQRTIDMLSSTGGNVIVKRASYDLQTTGITMPYDSVQIEFEKGAIWRYSGTGAALTLGSDGAFIEDTTLINYNVEAYDAAVTSADASGLKVVNLLRSTISYPRIEDFSNYVGLWFTAYTNFYGATVDIIRPHIWNCKWSVLFNSQNASDSLARFNDVNFYGGTIGSQITNNLGVYIDKGQTIKLHDVDFEGNLTEAAKIDDSFNELIDCRFESTIAKIINVGASANNTRLIRALGDPEGFSITDSGTHTIIQDCVGYITKASAISDAFSVAVVALETVYIANPLSTIPATHECQITLIRNTNVNDYTIGFIRIISTDADWVTVQVNITVASATGGATAKLGLYTDSNNY